ncbi:MAG: sigma-54-dependent transcriptional regulator [Candidatus Aminicenantes bacterium]
MRNKPQILVIDDEKDIGQFFKKVLSQEGYTVLTALDGISGLQAVEEKKPDIVLLDLKMPKMDGIEVLRRIKKIDKNTVVIIITGYGTMDSARMAMKFGAFDYITKPIELEHVKAVVQDGLKLALRAFGNKIKEKEKLRSRRSQLAKLTNLRHCKENLPCVWEAALRAFVLGDDDFMAKWMEDPKISKHEKVELTKIAAILKGEREKRE